MRYMSDVTPTPDDGSRPGNYGGQAMSDLKDVLMRFARKQGD